MSGGYGLDFENRTYEQFFADHLDLNIYDERFQINGAPKARLMRAFWTLKRNQVVAKLLGALSNHAVEVRYWPNPEAIVADLATIVDRLRKTSNVPDVDAFTATVNRQDFEAAARLIRDAI